MDNASLNTLMEIATAARDAAMARHAQMERQADQARRNLAVLRGYAGDYAQRGKAQPGDGLDPAAQANWRAFLARLQQAQAAQAAEVERCEHAAAAAGDESAQCQRKLKSLQALARRRAEEAARIEARRDQKHTDEIAQRVQAVQAGGAGAGLDRALAGVARSA
jgi:flagellar FliJ protein